MTNLPPRGLPFTPPNSLLDELVLQAYQVEAVRHDHTPAELRETSPELQTARRVAHWLITRLPPEGRAAEVEEAKRIREEYKTALALHVAENQRIVRERGSDPPTSKITAAQRQANTAALLARLSASFNQKEQ